MLTAAGRRFVAVAFLVAAGPAAANAAPAASDAVAAYRRELPFLLIDEADLKVSTTPHLAQTIAPVELFFSSPLAFPTEASGWADVAESAPELGPLFVLGDQLLGGSR